MSEELKYNLHPLVMTKGNVEDAMEYQEYVRFSPFEHVETAVSGQFLVIFRSSARSELIESQEIAAFEEVPAAEEEFVAG